MENHRCGLGSSGRRRAGVWCDPGLDRADHDRHPSFISDALGVSTRKVKTITEELCGRTFSGQHGQPGQTVCCTALRRTGSTRRIRIWWCMYATRNTIRIGPYARDPRWIAPLPPAPRPGAASSEVAPGTGSIRTGTPFDRPASGGTDVVRHRTWRTRALLPIGRITLSASPQRGLGVPLYDNSGVRTHGHRQALRRGGSPARPVHPVRSRPGVRRGRPPGRRTGPWALVNEAFAKRFGGGRRTVIGTRLQMTAIDVDDQGREIASASWSTCGHAGVTATAPTVFVPVERVPDDLLGQVHRGPNVQSAPLASRCRRASGLIVWSVANVAPGGDVERLGDCRGSPRSGSACTSAGTCASRRCVPPPAPPTGDADAWCSGRNPRVVRKTRKSLWHQMEDGVWCSIPCAVGTRIAPDDARAAADRWSQASVRTSTRAWRSRGEAGGRCRTDACFATRSSAAATVGDWQRSTAGGEHRSGRIWPRLRGCVLSSARP